MAGRTNILLVLALAAGVAYGYVGVPFLLPLVSGDSDATAYDDLEGQPFIDQMVARVLLLRPGMHQGEVCNVLGLGKKPDTSYLLMSPNGPNCMHRYLIDGTHVVRLYYDNNNVLTSAQLTANEARGKPLVTVP